jgi:hypothetical protein
LKKSFNEIQSEKEELNEYGYPIHKESDYKKRPVIPYKNTINSNGCWFWLKDIINYQR